VGLKPATSESLVQDLTTTPPSQSKWWNDLPSELKNSDIGRQGFKSHLKSSWLFECAILVTGASVNFCLFKGR